MPHTFEGQFLAGGLKGPYWLPVAVMTGHAFTGAVAMRSDVYAALAAFAGVNKRMVLDGEPCKPQQPEV